tara:strand:+ start:4527 stop:4763 length:237 start_codon:yes stop_codon:yes gene_type:complete
MCTASGLLLSAGSASAQLDNVFLKPDDVSHISAPGVDKDEDGCLSKSEVTPGGQLDKRFATRDANGDGKLCKDEYYFP